MGKRTTGEQKKAIQAKKCKKMIFEYHIVSQGLSQWHQNVTFGLKLKNLSRGYLQRSYVLWIDQNRARRAKIWILPEWTHRKATWAHWNTHNLCQRIALANRNRNGPVPSNTKISNKNIEHQVSCKTCYGQFLRHLSNPSPINYLHIARGGTLLFLRQNNSVFGSCDSDSGWGWACGKYSQELEATFCIIFNQYWQIRDNQM